MTKSTTYLEINTASKKSSNSKLKTMRQRTMSCIEYRVEWSSGLAHLDSMFYFGVWTLFIMFFHKFFSCIYLQTEY